MNAKKQKRVKTPRCMLSLMLGLLGVGCDCIIREKIDFVVLGISCQLALACENYYTLE